MTYETIVSIIWYSILYCRNSRMIMKRTKVIHMMGLYATISGGADVSSHIKTHIMCIDGSFLALPFETKDTDETDTIFSSYHDVSGASCGQDFLACLQRFLTYMVCVGNVNSPKLILTSFSHKELFMFFTMTMQREKIVRKSKISIANTSLQMNSLSLETNSRTLLNSMLPSG
jgi:hypothetical protein